MHDTALLLCDLQNDLLSEGGAYHRAAGPCAARSADVPIVSPHFNLVPLRSGEPHIPGVHATAIAGLRSVAAITTLAAATARLS